MVRGPVGDMNDGCYMLSGEGMDAFSPRFKSKRRSEGPDIFKGVEEKRGQTNRDLRSAMKGVSMGRNSSVLRNELLILYKNQHLTGFQRSKRQAQKSKRRAQKSKRPIQKSNRQAQKSETHLLFQTCQHLSHAYSACGNHRQFVEAPISDIEEAFAFPNVSASITCTLSLAEITGNLSKISGDVEST
ncbi:hypothetical protein ACFXTO_007947 [Malus domestica]